jgi:hypothetical protein
MGARIVARKLRCWLFKMSTVKTIKEPTFSVPVIRTRPPDGSILIKAGRPEVVEDEVTISEFHRETRVSKRYIAELCEQGLIQHRRLTPKKDSKILIPRSELDRYLHLDDEAFAAVSATLARPGGNKSPVPPRGVRQIGSGRPSNHSNRP